MVICFLGCLDQINVFTDIFLNTYLCMKFSMYNLTECLSVIRSLNSLNPLITGKTSYFLLIWQPPAFPYRHQYSIIGRFRLNHRVRDVDGCFPKAHRHQNMCIKFCGTKFTNLCRKLAFLSGFVNFCISGTPATERTCSRGFAKRSCLITKQ